MNDRPLIAHVLYRLDTGGMEHFVLTLVNHTAERYRHAIVCLTEFGPMRRQIVDPTIPCLALHKRPGKDWPCYVRYWRTLRALKPDLVHGYNIGTLDLAPVARAAGVRRVVHAERGRDASDPRGANRRYRSLRRVMSPFIARWLPVSRDLESWLVHDVGIAATKVSCIPNGIDVQRFARRACADRARPLLGDFAPPGTRVIINVGRLDPVKDQAGLIDAFRMLGERDPQVAARLKLVIVGDGPERATLEGRIAGLGLEGRVRLLGNRDDVPALLGEADVFALSSLAEGMPGVVLEAMASGLPVVATSVGGVGELVVEGETGALVAPSEPEKLAAALERYVGDPDLCARQGHAGRARVESRFSLASMVNAYVALYDGLLAGRALRPQPNATAGIAGSGEH